MRVDIKKITNVVSKISDITSGDKQVPGVMFDLSDGVLKCCYSDGHKSFVEYLTVDMDETDKVGAVAVDFAQLKRIIENCQPSGSIKVDKVNFEYKEKVITVSVNQNYEQYDAEGNLVATTSLGNKNMDLAWSEPGSDMRSAILTRMDYDKIFGDPNLPVRDDEYDKKELLDALARTSVEKGKQIYVSNKMQTIFVINQAHVTSVPISKSCTLSTEELDEIRGELSTSAEGFSEEKFTEIVRERENRIHYSIVMAQNISKAIQGVFGKTESDKVYVHTAEKFVSMFIDTDEEKIGFWFEMGVGSRAHIGSIERYNSLGYKNYQLKFLREFLVDNIKSAVNATKSNTVAFKFGRNDEGLVELIVAAGSNQASISDVYKVATYECLDPTETLESKVFNVSLPVFSAMLDQLKTPIVTLDFNCTDDGTTCIRLAELDDVKDNDAYMAVRREIEQQCLVTGEDPSQKPTPVEKLLDFRADTLNVKQYTVLAK